MERREKVQATGRDPVLTAGLGGSQRGSPSRRRAVAGGGPGPGVWEPPEGGRQKLAQTEDLSLALLGEDGVLPDLGLCPHLCLPPLGVKGVCEHVCACLPAEHVCGCSVCVGSMCVHACGR